jgi:hypothetical protein
MKVGLKSSRSLETLTGYGVGQDPDLARWLKPPPAFSNPTKAGFRVVALWRGVVVTW